MIEMRRQATPTPMTFSFFSWILFDSEFRKKKSCKELDKSGYKQVQQITFVFFSLILCDSEFQKAKSLNELAKWG